MMFRDPFQPRPLYDTVSTNGMSQGIEVIGIVSFLFKEVIGKQCSLWGRLFAGMISSLLD